VTQAAVELTRQNVARLGIADRLTVTQGDLFAPLEGQELEGAVDVIVCNPPYISTGRLMTERSGLLRHEPREAFDGGPYGLSIHQRVLSEARRFLKAGGFLMMEFGLAQDRQVKMLFDRSRAYDNVRFVADPAGNPRVVIGQPR
jgi:release factor glutamine methyltransferase